MMIREQHTFEQKIILTLHTFSYLSVILSPFYLSWETQIKYGYLISYLMTATIISWIFTGRCIIGDLENSNKYGTLATFFTVIVGINMNNYSKQFQNFVTYSNFIIKIYYAPTIFYMFFSIIFFICYKWHKWIKTLNITEIVNA